MGLTQGINIMELIRGWNSQPCDHGYNALTTAPWCIHLYKCKITENL